jgi:hypothetical protein
MLQCFLGDRHLFVGVDVYAPAATFEKPRSISIRRYLPSLDLPRQPSINHQPAAAHKVKASSVSNMKVTATIAGLVALTSVASAFPFGGGKGDKEWKDFKDYPKGFPFKFTSIYQVTATPDQVVNANNTLTPGEPGAVGYYNYGINSELDLICWYITLKGVTGPYQSPARTATQ